MRMESNTPPFLSIKDHQAVAPKARQNEVLPRSDRWSPADPIPANLFRFFGSQGLQASQYMERGGVKLCVTPGVSAEAFRTPGNSYSHRPTGEGLQAIPSSSFDMRTHPSTASLYRSPSMKLPVNWWETASNSRSSDNRPSSKRR